MANKYYCELNRKLRSLNLLEKIKLKQNLNPSMIDIWTETWTVTKADKNKILKILTIQLFIIIINSMRNTHIQLAVKTKVGCLRWVGLLAI